jgi:uncharacterized protein (TIGR02145 family)
MKQVGLREYDVFILLDMYGNWWSFDEDSEKIAKRFTMTCYNKKIDRLKSSKKRGHSVRCIKDN